MLSLAASSGRNLLDDPGYLGVYGVGGGGGDFTGNYTDVFGINNSTISINWCGGRRDWKPIRSRWCCTDSDRLPTFVAHSPALHTPLHCLPCLLTAACRCARLPATPQHTILHLLWEHHMRWLPPRG